MDILSLIGWRTEEGERSSGSTALALDVGDRLHGRVSRLLHQNLALVDLLGGRYKAVAELKTPLNPGQRLTFKVTATSPQLALQVVQGEKQTGGGAHAAPRSAQPALQILNPQQNRSLINDIQALATALKETPADGKPAAGTLASATVEAAKVATSLERLASHLAPLAPSGEPKAIATKLQAHVRDGGQLLLQKLVDAVQGRGPAVKAPGPAGSTEQGIVPERGQTSETLGGKLSRLLGGKPAQAPANGGPAAKTPLAQLLSADLKPHLQRLLIQLPALMETLDPGRSLASEGSGHLWSTVAALLDEMDSGQARLSEHRPEDPPAVMRHSMRVEGRDEPLRLNVYLPRKGRRKDTPEAAPMVSLLLDLKRFGPVRVDVRERMSVRERMDEQDIQQQLCVDFMMNSQDTCDELGAAVAPLAHVLETLYPQVKIEVAIAPEKIAAFEQDAGPGGPAGSNSGKLDIRI